MYKNMYNPKSKISLLSWIAIKLVESQGKNKQKQEVKTSEAKRRHENGHIWFLFLSKTAFMDKY